MRLAVVHECLVVHGREVAADRLTLLPARARGEPWAEAGWDRRKPTSIPSLRAPRAPSVVPIPDGLRAVSETLSPVPVLPREDVATARHYADAPASTRRKYQAAWVHSRLCKPQADTKHSRCILVNSLRGDSQDAEGGDILAGGGQGWGSCPAHQAQRVRTVAREARLVLSPSTMRWCV